MNKSLLENIQYSDNYKIFTWLHKILAITNGK